MTPMRMPHAGRAGRTGDGSDLVIDEVELQPYRVDARVRRLVRAPVEDLGGERGLVAQVDVEAEGVDLAQALLRHRTAAGAGDAESDPDARVHPEVVVDVEGMVAVDHEVAVVLSHRAEKPAVRGAVVVRRQVELEAGVEAGADAAFDVIAEGVGVAAARAGGELEDAAAAHRDVGPSALRPRPAGGVRARRARAPGRQAGGGAERSGEEWKRGAQPRYSQDRVRARA